MVIRLVYVPAQLGLKGYEKTVGPNLKLKKYKLDKPGSLRSDTTRDLNCAALSMSQYVLI